MAFRQNFSILILALAAFFIVEIQGRNLKQVEKSQSECNLPDSLIKEIKSYAPTVKKIFDAAVNGNFKGKTYEQLETFIERFGGRLSGSKNLENSIDYMVKYWKKLNVSTYTEDVKVPFWVRGNEVAYMSSPFEKNMSIIGLGHSIPTPDEGITADVLVVRTFEELEAKASKAKGKIVVFNQEYHSGSSVQGDYGATVKYRSLGAVEAAKVGAVGALVRSVGPGSIYSAHGGYVFYNENVTKIPTGSITIEDAELLYDLQTKFKRKITIQMKLDDKNNKFITSRNTFGELKGEKNPDEIVILSGHIDSWDNGQGVMDDAGGSWITVHAAALLNQLGLTPRRTLRCTLWTAEELGFFGVKGYIKDHQKELIKHKAVMESDIGTWSPVGLDYAGSDEGACIMKEIVKLFRPLKANSFRQLTRGEVGSDIIFLAHENIPSVSLNTKNSMYFWYHHTQGDTMALENSEELDRNLAVWAAAGYIIADMSAELPKESTKKE